MLFLIAVALLIVLALWCTLEERGSDPAEPRCVTRSARPTISAASRCVSVTTHAMRSKRIGEKRFLSGEAPEIPVPGCNAATCACHYVHHKDRRHNDRRNPFPCGRPARPPPRGRSPHKEGSPQVSEEPFSPKNMVIDDRSIDVTFVAPRSHSAEHISRTKRSAHSACPPLDPRRYGARLKGMNRHPKSCGARAAEDPRSLRWRGRGFRSPVLGWRSTCLASRCRAGDSICMYFDRPHLRRGGFSRKETIMFNRRVRASVLSASAALGVAGASIAQVVPPDFKASPDVYKVLAENDQYRLVEGT